MREDSYTNQWRSDHDCPKEKQEKENPQQNRTGAVCHCDAAKRPSCEKDIGHIAGRAKPEQKWEEDCSVAREGRSSSPSARGE